VIAINVNIRKLHEDAVIPRYATEGAAAFDLVSVEDVIIAPGETALVPLGLAFEIPEGYVMDIRPRSGIAKNTKLRIGNAPGTCYSDFRGEVNVIIDNIAQPELTAWYSEEDGYVVTHQTRGYLFTLDSDLDEIYYGGPDATTVPLEYGYWRPDKTYLIRKGDRIAQALIQRIPHVEFTLTDALSETQRGDGGFGSSGVTTEVVAE